jgi:diadenylate cyclase
MSSLFGVAWSDLLGVILAGTALVWIALRVRGPGARQVAVGAGLVLAGVTAGQWTGLFPENWHLARWWPEAILALVIILQPEIRKALAAIGRFPVRQAAEPEARFGVEEVLKAAVALGFSRTPRCTTAP